ncbi:uncharacterized protein BDV14DRAFT_168916 [Aspergillus stella-maris]|uniref:uncharacterized protein n=1 Tax=Aspergillus stella-maris TaxID=1810926 RepID=UPI003CCD9EC9
MSFSWCSLHFPPTRNKQPSSGDPNIEMDSPRKLPTQHPISASPPSNGIPNSHFNICCEIPNFMYHSART